MADQPPADGPFVEPTELAGLEQAISEAGEAVAEEDTDDELEFFDEADEEFVNDSVDPDDEDDDELPVLPVDPSEAPDVRPADQVGAEDDPDADQGAGVREPEGEVL